MANEKRLIDANPFMKAGWHLVRTGKSNTFLASMSIADVPTVDAVEVVHASWQYGRFNTDGEYEEQCSNCKMWSREYGHDYCPNCGAKMDGDGNE